jgi:ribosomal protein S18 acetylase RimI-like enzyme
VPAAIRELRKEELCLMPDLMYEAIYLPEGLAPYPRDIIKLPVIDVYISDFGKYPTDHCLLAEVDGSIAGGVWTRFLAGQTKTYEYVEADAPELVIAVFGEYRNQGVGLSLMNAMIKLLGKKGYGTVCLSVDKSNYAVGMYRKLGFKAVGENAIDYVMELSL